MSVVKNHAKNPSPQLSATGWNTSFSGARASGAGVSGYGYVATCVTSVAAGAGSVTGYGATPTTDFPVVAGASFLPSLYVKPLVTNRFALLVRFYNASNGIVGSDIVQAAQVVTGGAFTRLVGTAVTVPLGAVAASIHAQLAAGTGAVQVIGTRTNRLKNPSGQVSLTGVSGSGATLGLNPGANTYATAAGASAALTIGGVLPMTVGTDIPANTQCVVSAEVFGEGTDTMLYVSGTGVAVGGPSAAGNGFTRVSAVFTTGASGTVNLYFLNSALTVSPHRVYFRRMLVEVGTAVGSYFDGSTVEAGRTIAWTGTANNSASTRSGDTITVDRVSDLAGEYGDGSFAGRWKWDGTAYASASSFYTSVVAVTAFDDMDPSPRAEIAITDTYPGADSLTVVQLSSEGEVIVRNGIRIGSAGGAFVTDYEIPLGVSVQYRVEQFTVSGASLGLTDPVAVQVDIPFGQAVFQDYLAPDDAVMVGAERRFAETLERHRTVKRYRAGTETIALMGQQGLLEGVTLRCVTLTDEDQDSLTEILNQGTVLVRTMPPMPVPRLLFVVLDAVRRIPIDARWQGEKSYFDITGDEVSRNTLDVIAPVVTWQRIIDAYPTWADLIAAHSTWLDLIANPPPEV